VHVDDFTMMNRHRLTETEKLILCDALQESYAANSEDPECWPDSWGNIDDTFDAIYEKLELNEGR